MKFLFGTKPTTSINFGRYLWQNLISTKTEERVAAWNQIAERLNAIPDVCFKVSQRAVRERFDKLMREFKSKEANEKRASGITTEYDEIDQALLDIKERMEDAE